MLAIGFPAGGAAHDALERTLQAVLGGSVRHGGALLAPFAIRYVVAEPGSLPAATAEALAEQIDVDLVQRAGGLLVYRNARALPQTAAFPAEAAAAARSSDLLAPTEIEPGVAQPLRGRGETRLGRVGQEGVAVVADEFDPAWSPGTPFPAFGWAIGVEVDPGFLALRFAGRVPWLVQLGGLALLWLAALWVIRRRPAEELHVRPETAAVEPRAAVGRAS